ncbi:hypothetical protein Zm00014a_007970 [Zea mays]|uniref:Uncharacterized protein n=1 Tax=Zea mays TaxID=4577 RepID=A0A3L6DBA7_MAIZE|nr:hypothetical protein Zm00014a_007970 [Zea mays]
MTFADKDLLLGIKKHNRPLLMLGEIDDLVINRIMIDGGSAINLLPLRTLKRIGYSAGDLSQSNVYSWFSPVWPGSIGNNFPSAKVRKACDICEFPCD